MTRILRMGCCKVVAVIVTHNRPDLLILSLDGLRTQSVRLEAIIVVDNASDTETIKLLQRQKELIVLRIERNIGGSGGFGAGIKEALYLNPDWIWLVEDDVDVETHSLAKLLCLQKSENFDTQKLGLLCPTVKEFGRVALMHRRYFDPFTLREKPVPIKKYLHPIVEIDIASFVGALISANALRRVGVPDERFFLSYDDVEFSLRLKNAGYRLYLVPESKVTHRRSVNSRLRRGPYGLKHYYNLRNRIIVYRKFGHATLWRWILPLAEGLALLILAGRGKPKAVKLYLKAIKDGRREPYVVKDRKLLIQSGFYGRY